MSQLGPRFANPSRSTACPWCGYAGVEIDTSRGVGSAPCDECARALTLSLPVPQPDDDDDEFLEDTAEYDIVPVGHETFQVIRR